MIIANWIATWNHPGGTVTVYHNVSGDGPEYEVAVDNRFEVAKFWDENAARFFARKLADQLSGALLPSVYIETKIQIALKFMREQAEAEPLPELIEIEDTEPPPPP